MKKKLTRYERSLLRFYKEVPHELEKQNVNWDKYANLEKTRYQIHSREWINPVSNKINYLFTGLEQLGAGEVRDQECFCLLLMPKAAFVIELVGLDYVTNSKWLGCFCEPYSFEQYSLNYVKKVLDRAMLARTDKQQSLKMSDPRGDRIRQIKEWRENLLFQREKI